jgi:hypothetical protein
LQVNPCGTDVGTAGAKNIFSIGLTTVAVFETPTILVLRNLEDLQENAERDLSTGYGLQISLAK